MVVYNMKTQQYGVLRHQKIQSPYPAWIQNVDGKRGGKIEWKQITVVNVIDPETWEEKRIHQSRQPITDFTDWDWYCVPKIYEIPNCNEVADTIYELGKYLGFREMMENHENWHISTTSDGDYEIEEHVMLTPKKMWSNLKQILGLS